MPAFEWQRNTGCSNQLKGPRNSVKRNPSLASGEQVQKVINTKVELECSRLQGCPQKDEWGIQAINRMTNELDDSSDTVKKAYAASLKNKK